ncbi:hypothetical protein B0H13DRAFT_2312554 [Mycena leptocephala]|nr:hypothetical protein B0H13DRAFT_2312554 [Mycena leptocephala]
MGPLLTFSTGENVLCYHGPLIYVARILQTADAAHLVHYKGWNAKWDEWVPESRLLKDTEENRARQRDALETAAATRLHSKASASKVNRDRNPRTKRKQCIHLPKTAATENAAGKQKTGFAPLGSPTKPVELSSKMLSFASPTKSSAAKAVVANMAMGAKPVSTPGSPSPTKHKLVRAPSFFNARQPPSFMRTLAGPGGSSLETLASALEKLRIPPPERPNTSMGFSRDQLNGTLRGMERPGLQRAEAVGGASSSTSSIGLGVNGPSVLGMALLKRRDQFIRERWAKVGAERCIVYVDVISEFGDDSAKLFIVDMLKNLGAKVLGSVGHTLTHIVYKNGLGRTLRGYRRLPGPKPLVVGMEWVIQSAKKGTHENETPYIIDTNDMNTATMKRSKAISRLTSGVVDDNGKGDSPFESEGSLFSVCTP